MSKYIEFVVKVVRSKSKRKTRKRGGGDITTCDLTPLEGEVTVEQLKTKIRTPEPLDNLTLISHEVMSGAYNIARRVTCTKKSKKSTSEEIICRVWKKALNVGSDNTIKFVDGSRLDNLERFATELTISINQGENTLPIYDIKAITIGNKLLERLDHKEIFGQNVTERSVCLCVIMKKGEPYEITRDNNFRKTMNLFERIAENYFCVDIKTDNLLCSNDSRGRPNVVMIDWDPKLVLELRYLYNIHDKVLLSSCMMKYLFCMFSLINLTFYDERFIEGIITELEGIINEQITLTDDTTESVLFIITSFYNNTKPSDGLCLHENIRGMFRRTFSRYLLDRVTEIPLDLYMNIRKYVIDCREKAKHEERCLQSIGNYTVVYNNHTKSLQYSINNECTPGLFHSLKCCAGLHSCSTELKNVELTYDTEAEMVNITYEGNRKKIVEVSDVINSPDEIIERTKFRLKRR
jgi:hypothetical protein